MEMIKFALLQMFAEAGTLVNATGNYVNAYTGDTQAFDDAHSLAGELKVFYDTELLENARIDMFYAQFAKRQALPKNHGTTVEWRKWNTFAKAEDKKVKIHIPRGASNEDPNFYIKVNGVRYVLPKGKDHMVPAHIAYEFERSKRAMEIQDENRANLLDAAKQDLPR